MLSLVSGALLAASLATTANAECANACNGHGKCTAYDMCICNRNWQGNDCNQRVCQFGLAHVDTPKGDLDMSGALSGPDHPVADNHPVYPYGTTEQFPQMEDSDLRALDNSAHYYMECSNKGSCDRNTGECSCYDGYDGVACQRAACPNSCSGHGVCKTISQLAAADTGNAYKLWDQDATMGCECDSGYYAADCSQRDCKYGVDPLYLDDAATAKVGIYDFAVLTTGEQFSDGMKSSGTSNGEWAIRFFDSFGEDWLTTAIPAWASCVEVTDALYALPNNVIPADSLSCTRTEYTTGTDSLSWAKTGVSIVGGDGTHTVDLAYKMAVWNTIADPALVALPISFGVGTGASVSFVGDIYRIKFGGNPGALTEPQIEIYLDGKSASLRPYDGGDVIVTFVVTDGQQGEDNDYFADHCDGVTVTIDAITANTAAGYVALGGLDAAETKLLKACLGDSNGDTTDNIEVFDWDYGSETYPHLIKLVRTVTSFLDGGYYAALYWTGTEFALINPFAPPDAVTTDSYDIYTTTGTFEQVSADAVVLFGYGQRHIVTASSAYQSAGVGSGYDGEVACEADPSSAYVFHCVNASDIITVLDFDNPGANSPYINLYTAKRVWTTPYYNTVKEAATTIGASSVTEELHRGTHIIETDLTLNWGNDDQLYTFNVYKFVPASASTYEYVAPCSNRGVCNTDSGVCGCFPGYTNDNCDTQNSLAL